MDAVKFIEERDRMCKSFDKYCYGCPAWDGSSCKLGTGTYLKYEADKKVKIVEEWSAAHPRKTRRSVFLEQYPEASCVDNILVACPKVIDKNFFCRNTYFNCAECRREFWMHEVE